MVTFTTDPRIAYAQGMRKDYLQRALSPIQLPQNPYGGSPLASALQRVTEGYLAGQEGRRAAEFEKAQSDARSEVLSGLLKAGSARTGQLSQRQVPLPGPDYAMTRTEYSIGDDGAQIPTIDPTVLEAAGIEPAAYQVALASAKAQGDKLTQARLEKDIKNRLREVGTMLVSDPQNEGLFAETEQLRALLVPEDVAKETVADQRAKDKERRAALAERQKELRKLDETTKVVVDRRPGSPTEGQAIPITNQMLLDDIEAAKQGNPRKFSATTGLKLDADGRLVAAGGLGQSDTDDFAAGRLSTAFDISRAFAFQKMLEEIPGVSGFTGAISDIGGGILGQVPVVGKKLEEAFAKALTGATPEQRSQYVVTGRAIIGSMIDDMSGEQSKRFSEPERKIAEQALKNMQPGASASQIIGATRAAIKGYIIFLAKADLALNNKPVPLNAVLEDGTPDDKALIPYVEQLERLGFNEEDIIDILTQINTAYKLIPDMAGG